MRKILATVAASAAMLVSAWAAEMEGTVKEINLTDRTITLEDATVVQVAAEVDLAGVEAGDKVMITTNDANVATEVVVAE